MEFYKTLGQYLLEPWREVKVGYGMDKQYLDPVVASVEKQSAVKFDLSGRIGTDLRFLFQKTMNGVPRYRFKRYALDPVAKRLLGEEDDGKIDMPAKEMFRIWKSGTTDEVRRFCDYCIVDGQLLVDIIDKEEIISQLVAMANTSHTSLHGIVNEGQFRKVENATVVNAAKLGAFTNNNFRGIPDIEMKGAMVVEPVKGPHGAPSMLVDEPTDQYIDMDTLPPDVRTLVDETLPNDKKVLYKSKTYVAVLDFASLYPSIMMSFIMCIMTIILPGKEGDSRVERAYRDPKVPETGLIIHEEIIYEDDDPKKAILRRNRFVQNAKAPFTNGILPKWEADLKEMRKRYKELMNEVPTMRGVYDARQLATKISMNSVYGVLKLFCVYIAESVTNRGRTMLNTLIAWLTRLGYEVIYGDSVSEDTPIVVRINGGRPKIMRIGDVVNDDTFWETYHGDKETADVSEYLEVLDENGWTRVKRVIRHKTRKQMWRVTTHTGVVDCTEDHSLIDPIGTKLRPRDVSIGDELMHRGDSIPFEEMETSIGVEEAEAMGMFFADGSCNEYGTKWGPKYSWALNKSDVGFLDRAKHLLPFETKIIDTLKSSGVYKLVPVGELKDPTVRYRSLFYNRHCNKVVPDEIMYGPIQVVRAFFEGFYAGDGDKKGAIYKEGLVSGRFDHKSKTSVAHLVFLCQRLGYQVSINSRVDKPDIFRVTFSFNAHRRSSIGIKKMTRLEPGERTVYDLETESHHFHVAPGNLVVHNTDSVMIKRSFDTINAAWDHFTSLETRLNDELYSREGDVNALEFEKLYKWYLLMGKKAYIGLKKEKIHKPYELSSTGTCDVRRDRPAVLTDLTVLMGKIMSTCSALSIESTGLVVMEGMRRHFEKIVKNEFPPEKYAVTTTIQTINENTEKKAHMVLARRLEERDGVSFTVGDSIDVVQVKGHKKTPAAEKVATPEDIRADPRGAATIDTHLYFKQKVKSQTEKMAKWYIPEETLELMFKEYEGVLKPETKSGKVKSKSIFTMLGGDEEGRRKRLFEKSYKREIEKRAATFGDRGDASAKRRKVDGS